MSKLLRGSGLDVVIAENGQAALDVLAEDDEIELVLMDIMMPIMDGHEAMKCIRKSEKTANLPVIALTAKAMAEDRQKYFDSGASDYLAKTDLECGQELASARP